MQQTAGVRSIPRGSRGLEPGAGRRRPGAGYLLTLLPMMLVVLLVGLFIFNFMTRQQHRGVHRYSLGQEALALAEAGLAQAMTFLATPAGDALRAEVLQALLESSESGVKFEKELDFENLRTLVADDPGRWIKVTLRVADFRPLPAPSGARAFLPDPGEATGRLEVASQASCHGIVRTAVRARLARVVHPLPGVLAKFALLVEQSTDLAANVNCLRYDSAEGLFRDAASGARSAPVVVHAAPRGAPGSAPVRDLDSGRLLPLADALGAGEKAALDSGWIALGGPDPWMLNLTFGACRQSPFEEHHLLRRLEYVFPSPALGPPFEQKGALLGFAQGVTRLPWIAGADSGFRSPSTGAAVPERTSLMHLAGDLSGATPTVCLGPVFRRYLAYDKVRRGPAGPFESFVNLADAEAFQRAGGSFAQLTGKGFDAYQQIMARVVEEPYNRTYDYLVTARESSDPDRPGQVAAGSTPARPGRLLTRPGLLSPVLAATGGASLAASLYPASSSGQPLAFPSVRISRRSVGSSSVPIFQGQLGKLEELEPTLLSKVTRLYPTAADLQDKRSFGDCFIRQTPAGQALDLGGHVVRLPRGDLRLGGLQVAGGGMLLAAGDIVVDGPIECAAGEALSLVSLQGSIRIATSSRVQASLAALRGQIVPPAAGGMEILGTVACRDLANFQRWLENPGVKRIVYDARLDPTRAETHGAFYRLVLTDEETRYLLRY